MTVTVSKTVREIALEHTSAPSILEKLGIDYCCGGQVPFDEACRRKSLDAETVYKQLTEAAVAFDARQVKIVDWNRETLTDLVAHINATHHVYVRNESPRLMHLATKVAAKHGGHKPELIEVESTLGALLEELRVHLMKEEEILFPFVIRTEESSIEGAPAPPAACFGSIEHPIAMMMHEHDNAGDALRKLRKLTDDYRVPVDACMSYTALFDGLREFEADLHQHIHLENNILFPRAIAMAG